MNMQRLLAVLFCCFSGLTASVAHASDQAIFATMATCRAANTPLGNAMSKLDQLGWRQVTRRADRAKIAAHVSAGIHHTARGFDRSDYQSFRSSLLNRAGRTSSKLGTSTINTTIVFYGLGGRLDHQLVLKDDLASAPDGTRLTHSRACYVATPSHGSVKAFAALAEPVPHLGFRRMKGQWVDPRARRYWVRATHRTYPETGLPFRPLATDFLRIEASTASSN